MALSGFITVAATSYDTLKFSWSATQSVVNNSSVVNWKLELVSGKYGEIISSAAKAYTVIVDGNTYSGSNYINIGNNATKTLVSGSTTIKHNEDGTRAFSFSFSQALKIYWGEDYIGVKEGSGSATLDAIPRYATIIDAPNFTNGQVPQIRYSNPLGEDIESLQACISLDGTTDSVPYRDIAKDGTYYTFQLTTQESKTLLQAITGTPPSKPIYFIVKSVIGGVTNYSKLQRALTIVNSTPWLSPTVVDNDAEMIALTGNNKKFVRYYSNASYNVNATAKNYGTITKVSATHNGTTESAETGTFYNIESNTITFSATDNRGFTADQTVTLDLIEYVKLTCNLVASLPTAAGELDLEISGNYFNGSFGAENNDIAVQFRIKEESGSYSDWQTLGSTTITGNTYKVATTVSGLDYKKAYKVQARALDKVEFTGNVESAEITVKAIPAFDWGENDFNFNVDIKMNGNTVLRTTDENKVVLSAEGADVYIRPNGSTTDEGQLRVTTGGKAYIDGVQMATVNDIPAAAPVPADYIIEQGDNGSYAYVKWNSGRLEAWRTSTSAITAAINSAAYGSMYYADGLSLSTTGSASQFVKVQCVQLTFNKNGNAGLYYPVVKNYTISGGAVTVNYMIVNPLQRASSSTVVPNLYIIGRWK